MFNSKKSQYVKSLSTFLRLFLLVIFTLPVAAVDLPFDPNDFSCPIYGKKEGELRKNIGNNQHLLIQRRHICEQPGYFG